VEKIDQLFQMMCPAGNGVYTVHTAKEIRESFQQEIYKTVEPSELIENWKESLQKALRAEIALFGIASDNGGGILRGANWGPLFLRQELLHECQHYPHDLGDIRVIPHLLHDKYLNQETLRSCREALYRDQNSHLPVSPLSVAEKCYQIFHEINPRLKILTFGGDHSISYPITKAWLETKNKQGLKVGIIHFDAHTDLLDKRLGVDLCFGSWAYHILPYLEEASDILQFGIRSSGFDRTHWENKLKVQQFWTNEIKEDINSVIEKAVSYIQKRKFDEVYISFDIDALDCNYASATGTSEPNGIEPHQAITLIKAISNVTKVTGADLVEVAPFVQSSHKSTITPEPQTTLQSSTLINQALLEAMES
jgi:agmatinase